jgi:hypothetical protein
MVHEALSYSSIQVAGVEIRCLTSKRFCLAASEQGWRRGLETTVDHALMRGLATAGPDTSRSCLGLETSVGIIRLLVQTRVLLP